MTGQAMDGVYLLQDQSSGGSTIIFDDVSGVKYSSVNQTPIEGGSGIPISSFITFDIVNRIPSAVVVRTSQRVRKTDFSSMCSRDTQKSTISYSFDRTTSMQMTLESTKKPDFLSIR